MNQRLKLLAEQAKLRAPLMLQYWGKIDALSDSEQEELENIEKFADLIIKECVEIVEKQRVPVRPSPSGEMAARWTMDALRECRDEIKEHFGLEEL